MNNDSLVIYTGYHVQGDEEIEVDSYVHIGRGKVTRQQDR